MPEQPSGGTADPSRSDDGDIDDPDLGSTGQMRSRKRTKHVSVELIHLTAICVALAAVGAQAAAQSVFLRA